MPPRRASTEYITSCGLRVGPGKGRRNFTDICRPCGFGASGHRLCADSCTNRCLVACAVRRAFPVQYGSGREGLAGRSYTTRRIHTCERLYQLVADRGYLLIKAPPQSGKTSTLQLLSEWASREHPSLDVVYINLSHEESGFQMNDVLRARLGGTLDEIIKGECSACACTVCPLGPADLLLGLQSIALSQLCLLVCLACCQANGLLRWGCMTTCMLAGGNSVLVCIEEVQIAYHVEKTGSADFWNQLKRLEGGTGILTAAHDTRVVMAAAYGTRPSAANTAEPESPTATPVNFEFPDMVVTIFPSPSGSSLQLSDAEWSELWDNFTGFTGLQLGNLIKDHVGSICSGQVRFAWVALPVVLYCCINFLPRSCPCASFAKQ